MGRGVFAPPCMDPEDPPLWEVLTVPHNVCVGLGMPNLHVGEDPALAVAVGWGRSTAGSAPLVAHWEVCHSVPFVHPHDRYCFDSEALRAAAVEWFLPPNARQVEMVLRVCWVTPRFIPPRAAHLIPVGEFLFLSLDSRDWSPVMQHVAPLGDEVVLQRFQVFNA
jgi:hypothetical protein